MRGIFTNGVFDSIDKSSVFYSILNKTVFYVLPFYSQVQYLLKVGGHSESDLPSHLDYWGGNSHSLELGEWMNVFFICNSLSLSRLMINRTSTSIQVATPFFPPTDWSGLPGGLFHLPTNNSSRNSEIA